MELLKEQKLCNDGKKEFYQNKVVLSEGKNKQAAKTALCSLLYMIDSKIIFFDSQLQNRSSYKPWVT